MEKRKIEYRDIENLYRELEAEINILNTNINIITTGVKRELEDMRKTGRTEPKQFVSIIKKAKSEREAKKNGYGNRFEFDLLDAVENGNVDFGMPKEKPLERKEFERLSYRRKKALEIDLRKKLVITTARIASAINIQKKYGSDGRPLKNTLIYQEKHKYLQKFLIRAEEFNDLVTERKQIYYGFAKDGNGNPVISASLPGYTRFSLHSGTFQNFQDIVEGVNKGLSFTNVKKRYPVANDGKSTLDLLLRNGYEYELPLYTTNMGMINTYNYNNADKYANELIKRVVRHNGSLNEKAFKTIIKKYKYNSREVMFLAERKEVGKKILIEIGNFIKQQEKDFYGNLKNRKIRSLTRLNRAIEEEREISAYYNKLTRHPILERLSEKEIKRALFTKNNEFKDAKNIQSLEFFGDDATVDKTLEVLVKEIRVGKREDIEIPERLLKRYITDKQGNLDIGKSKFILCIADQGTRKRILGNIITRMGYEQTGEFVDELLDEISTTNRNQKESEELMGELMEEYISLEP